MRHFTRTAALLCFAVCISNPSLSSAQIDSCTYVIMEAEGVCPAITAEGTAVCTSCRAGQLCKPSLDCMRTDSSCSLRMLARVQGQQCGDCPIGANPLPSDFVCTETGVEATATPDGGDQTPTPTDDGSGGTPTPTDDGSGGTPTPTDDGSGGTPTPTDDGSGGTPTPTDDGSGGTPTPTDDGSGGTPTRTPTATTTSSTPTEVATATAVRTSTATRAPTTPNGGGTVTPTRIIIDPTTPPHTPTTAVSTNTPVRTATSGTPAATRTATNGSSGSDGEGDDGCQVVAPAHSAASWLLVIPVLGFVAWRRRRRR